MIVTGDVDYHSAIDAVAQGIAVLDAGHYGTEYGFIAYMTLELETRHCQSASSVPGGVVAAERSGEDGT